MTLLSKQERRGFYSLTSQCAASTTEYKRIHLTLDMKHILQKMRLTPPKTVIILRRETASASLSFVCMDPLVSSSCTFSYYFRAAAQWLFFSFFSSLQRRTAWTISAGVTWFPNMASATTSSTGSSAACLAPARGHRAPVPCSLWLQASVENELRLEADGVPPVTTHTHTHRTVLDSCVFPSWST